VFDRWSYSIPANTSEADAISVECKISTGLLTELCMFFPDGCENLARARAFVGEKPVMPRSAKNYIAADGMPIYAKDLNEPITGNIPVINWHVWNLDDTYDHEIWLYAIWMSDEEPYQRATYFALSDFIKLLKKLFRME